MKTITVDVVVLGGGPGGYTAAFRAADLGRLVCLVEQRDCLGGVCLHEGCIPSKTLLHGTSLIDKAAQAADYGIRFGLPQIDIAALSAKKDQVVSQLTNGLHALEKARKIIRITGRGVFENRTTLVVETREGATAVGFTDAVIATGSSPVTLPDMPDDPRIWDSSDALKLTTIPKRLLIIGGGIIGMEMAQVYSALGTDITIVEMLDHIIPPADKDLVRPLFLQLKNRYRIFTQTKVTGIEVTADGLAASFQGAGALESAEFDAILVAVGRRPNTREMGFKRVGFTMDEQGFITTDEHLRTSVDHFYAVGDVTGEPMLAHKATHQAKVSAENICGKQSTFTPATIPSVAYTDPEVAWTGLTEKEAKAKKIAVVKGKFPWGACGRALSNGSTIGVTKTLFEKKTCRIIGAGICGAHAGELIHEAVIALGQGLTAHDISKSVHAHPTLAETFAFAAESVDGSITDALPPKKKRQE